MVAITFNPNNRVNADPQNLPFFGWQFNSFLPGMLSANWLAGRLRGTLYVKNKNNQEKP